MRLGAKVNDRQKGSCCGSAVLNAAPENTYEKAGSSLALLNRA